MASTPVAESTRPPAPPEIVNDRSFFGHPKGLATLFTTEMWERFSYYGLRPLLILFMTAAVTQGGWGFDTKAASAIVGIYAAFVYLMSLPGGWIADKWLGLRLSIWYGAILITLGHLAIGVSGFSTSKVPFFAGLAFIVLGTGLLKPNISAIVGDLYPEGGARRDAGFSIFYMGINMGAFFGQIITGYLGEKVGWHWGFGAAGVGMLIGLVTYWLFARKTLGPVGEGIVRHPDPAVQAKSENQAKMVALGIVGCIAVAFVLVATGALTIDPFTFGKYLAYIMLTLAVLFFAYVFLLGGITSDEKKRVSVIAVLFVLAIVFWSAFEQAPTSLTLFANEFTDRNVFGFEVPTTWFQSINSAFILLFAPAFAALWVALGKRGKDLSAPMKFALGLALAGIGFAIMIPAANAIANGNGMVKVSLWWLVFSYLFQTLGELSLSPVGLSSMTKLSPRKFVGQMMGIWFLASSLGNLMAGLVGGLVNPEELSQTPLVMKGTTLFLFAAAIVAALLAIPIKKMMANVRTEETGAHN